MTPRDPTRLWFVGTVGFCKEETGECGEQELASVTDKRRDPRVVTGAVIYLPIIALALGIEAFLIDRVAERFNPSTHPAGNTLLS